MTDTTLADSPARLSRADWLASLPRNTACSALVLHDAEYRLLLVHATYEDSWQFVGGVRDAQDDPWTTAVREAREEIGYELVGPPRLLGYDWVTFEDSEPAVQHFFRAPVLEPERLDSIRLSEEHDDWLLLSVEEWIRHLGPHRARRLRPVRDALRTGRPLCLRDGYPVT
ncbi:NUDIX domain-containing protein [Streptomyces sp. NEAU-PBA10]|uniref:NUDIX domain-containing protein n=1 Tax=Streptomyces TaxID=1883 RepID=UPI00189EE827|nr:MULTISPECIES: NUDIX hydrolase [Streptomyces]MBV1954167.1 NUDIX hydrolase [Streptomyces sp. BV333]UDF07893.1 NUDIX hydrolase [Streptomyces sp. WA1-19]UYX93068.1 NUDIX hydrolase [Streptomyces sp. BI87]